MPTYDYACKACDHRFEHFQSISDGTLRRCPTCGRRMLERLIGPGAGFIFKGSGFYATDYRSADYKKRAKDDAGPKPDSPPPSEKKPPLKPKKD